MTIPIIIDYITVAATLILVGLSIYKKGYKYSINKYFIVTGILISIWILLGNAANDSSISYDLAITLVRVAFFAGISVEILLMHFIAQLGGVKKYINFINRITLPIWVLGLVSLAPQMLSSLVPVGRIYDIKYGVLVYPFLALVLIIAGLIIIGFIQGQKVTKGVDRRRLIIIGIGMLAMFPLEILVYIILPMVGLDMFSEYTFAPMVIFTFFMYYSVIRLHLFDIRLAAVRSLAYVMSLGLLVGVYYGLISVIYSLMNVSTVSFQNPVGIFLIVVLLFLFQPTKKFFDILTNKLFYRDYYDLDEFLDRFNSVLTSTTDLRLILEKAAQEIAGTLKSSQAFFIVHTDINNDHDHYITGGTPGHTPIHIANKLHEQIHKIIFDKQDVIIAQSLDEDDYTRKLMDEHKIELILPIVKDGTVGSLLLGERLSSHYMSRDIKLLQVLNRGLAVAIKNALYVEEIRKNNSDLRRIDKVKDEFVSVASHELRTPMTIIRGYVNLIQRGQLGSLSDQQQAALSRISLNTKSLLELVGDMLDLSKLEAGKLEINQASYSLDTLLKNSINSMKEMYDNKGIALEYDGFEGMINTDSVQFNRVMTNLLSNAYKFTNNGGKVTVNSYMGNENSDGVEIATICVSDTGIGIDQEAIKGLFTKFSQVDNYLQRSSGGTGLGLAICKQIVEKLGGKIWFESTIGVGSKFIFTMPMSKSEK